MARIVLMGLGARDAALATGALDGHEVSAVGRGPLPAGTHLAIAARPPGRLAEGTTVLLLGPEFETTLPSGRKALDPGKLRAEVQRLLEGSEAAAAPGHSPWLAAPFLGGADARVLAAALRMGGPAWLAGEPGTGRWRVAGALARRWSPSGRLVPWLDGEGLAGVLARLAPGDVLLAADLDERPREQQRLLARTLAAEPSLRAVLTVSALPREVMASGRMEAAVAAALSPFVVSLAPLRERRAEVPRLAQVAAAALGVDAAFTEDASDVLQAWPWTGNFAELEAVVKRSLAALDAEAGSVRIDAGDLVMAPGATPAEAAAAPRGVVVDLGAAAASRQARAAGEAAPAEPTTPATAPGPEAVEALLAAFAHEIRNPMVTLKTFASLAAADPASTSPELARLASEAGDRVDEQLALLQRLAEKTDLAPARIDVVDVLGRAIEAAAAPDAVLLDEATALRSVVDPDLAELVCDALVHECRSRAAAGAPPAAAAVAGDAIVLRLAATAAADRLERWVEGPALPWRLALATATARRAGGALEIERDGAELVLRWKPALAAAAAREAAPAARGGR